MAFPLLSEYMEHIYSSWFLMFLSVSSIIDILFVYVSIDFFFFCLGSDSLFSCFFACLVVFFVFVFLIRYQTLWIILLVARFYCVPLNTIIFFLTQSCWIILGSFQTLFYPFSLGSTAAFSMVLGPLLRCLTFKFPTWCLIYYEIFPFWLVGTRTLLSPMLWLFFSERSFPDLG